jgi:anti-anti-sigma factor
MNIDWSNAYRLGFTGEMNIYAAAELQLQVQQALLAEGPIAVDLSEVSEIDSVGIQQLLLLQRECFQTQRALRITAQSAAVEEVFHLLNLRARFF